MKKVFLFFFVILAQISSKAQILENPIDTVQVRARISFVDEFIKRFNGKEDRPDLKKSSKNYDTKRILLLFNGKMFCSEKDSLLISARNFIDTINKENIKINYSDTTWFAKAECHGLFNKKEVDFTIYLSVEERGKDMFKWVINKVEGDIFNLTPHNIPKRIMIGPDAHEVKFIDLRHITKSNDKYISCYINKNKHVDETSVFLSYVYNGLLDIEYVSELEFIFFQVPNYVFTIKNFKRKTYNSGWLINYFTKISESEKDLFLKSIKN